MTYQGVNRLTGGARLAGLEEGRYEKTELFSDLL